MICGTLRITPRRKSTLHKLLLPAHDELWKNQCWLSCRKNCHCHTTGNANLLYRLPDFLHNLWHDTTSAQRRYAEAVTPPRFWHDLWHWYTTIAPHGTSWALHFSSWSVVLVHHSLHGASHKPITFTSMICGTGTPRSIHRLAQADHLHCFSVICGTRTPRSIQRLAQADHLHFFSSICGTGAPRLLHRLAQTEYLHFFFMICGTGTHTTIAISYTVHSSNNCWVAPTRGVRGRQAPDPVAPVYFTCSGGRQEHPRKGPRDAKPLDPNIWSRPRHRWSSARSHLPWVWMELRLMVCESAT